MSEFAAGDLVTLAESPAVERPRAILSLGWPLVLTLFAYMALAIWTRSYPVQWFIASAAALSLVTALVVMFARSELLVILHVLAFGLFIRLIQPIAVHFSGLTWGDPYVQFTSLRAFAEQGQATALPGSYGEALAIYSSWPGLNLLALTVHDITGLDLLSVALILPPLFFVLFFTMAYLFFRELGRSLRLPPWAVYVALLLLTISPFAMMPAEFMYQGLALVYLGSLHFLLWKRFSHAKPEIPFQFMILIFSASLIITHNFTSVVLAAYLVVLAIAVRLAQRRGLLGNEDSPHFAGLARLVPIMVLTWWVYYATISLTAGESVVEAFVTTLRNLSFTSTSVPVEGSANLVLLTPSWLKPLLLLRIVVLVLLPVFGGLLLLVTRQKTYARVFVLAIVGALAAFAILDLAFAPATVGLRVIILGTYFCVLLAAYALAWAHGRQRAAKLVIVPLLAVLSFSGVLGLWGTRYAPVHLYDPQVSLDEAGEHSSNWTLLEEFARRHIDTSQYDRVLTDDVYLVSLVLPWDEWTKAESIVDVRAKLDGKTLVVEFNGFNTTTYISQIGDHAYFNRHFSIMSFTDDLESMKEQIYDNGSSGIWR